MARQRPSNDSPVGRQRDQRRPWRWPRQVQRQHRWDSKVTVELWEPAVKPPRGEMPSVLAMACAVASSAAAARTSKSSGRRGPPASLKSGALNSDGSSASRVLPTWTSSGTQHKSCSTNANRLLDWPPRCRCLATLYGATLGERWKTVYYDSAERCSYHKSGAPCAVMNLRQILCGVDTTAGHRERYGITCASCSDEPQYFLSLPCRQHCYVPC